MIRFSNSYCHHKHCAANVVSAGLAMLASLSTITLAHADENIIRHALPDSDFPISLAVETDADAQTIYLSGTVPSVTNEDAEPNEVLAYGDTETQTRNVLDAISSTLESLDYAMGDVVKLSAFLAPDPENGDIDFDGFMLAYTEFFGTDEQPNLPARTAVPVPRLVNPGWLIEIEVIAAR